MGLEKVMNKKCDACGKLQPLEAIKANKGKCTTPNCLEVLIPQPKGAIPFVYIIHYKVVGEEHIEDLVYAGTPEGLQVARRHVVNFLKKHEGEIGDHLKASRLRDYWYNFDESTWIKIVSHNIVARGVVRMRKPGAP